MNEMQLQRRQTSERLRKPITSMQLFEKAKEWKLQQHLHRKSKQ